MIISSFISKLLFLSLIFFQVGIFTVGGGLAALTLMHQNLVPEYIEESAFYSFVAISESTPGPIGVNMSTYIGYEQMGILGAVLLTLALILPSFLSILVIAKANKKFQNSVAVQKVFYGLKAASTALIGLAVYRVLISSVFTIEEFHKYKSYFYLIGFKELGFFTVLLLLSFTVLKKMHPVFFIVIAAFFGALFL